MKIIVQLLIIWLCLWNSNVGAITPEDEKTLATLRQQLVLPTQEGELLNLTFKPDGPAKFSVKVGEKDYSFGNSADNSALPDVLQAVVGKMPCLDEGLSSVTSHDNGGMTVRCYKGLEQIVNGLKIPFDFPFYFEEIEEGTDVHTPNCTDSKPGDCSDKLAIIVHEPHFDIYGQYQLFWGLQSLIKANELSAKNTAFLMEAVDAGQTANPVLETAKKQIKEPWMFYRMLDFNIVNAPMLVNLVSDLNIPMPGIEDVKLFRENKYPEDFTFGFGFTDQSYMLSYRIFKEGLDKSSTREEKEIFQSEIRKLAEKYPIVNFYHQAVERDKIMQEKVSAYLAGKGPRYNFIFIGNAHEEAIVEGLKSQKTPYIVLKPRGIGLGGFRPYRIVETPEDYIRDDVMPNFKMTEYPEITKQFIKQFPEWFKEKELARQEEPVGDLFKPLRNYEPFKETIFSESKDGATKKVIRLSIKGDNVKEVSYASSIIGKSSSIIGKSSLDQLVRNAYFHYRAYMSAHNDLKSHRESREPSVNKVGLTSFEATLDSNTKTMSFRSDGTKEVKDIFEGLYGEKVPHVSLGDKTSYFAFSGTQPERIVVGDGWIEISLIPKPSSDVSEKQLQRIKPWINVNVSETFFQLLIVGR